MGATAQQTLTTPATIQTEYKTNRQTHYAALICKLTTAGSDIVVMVIVIICDLIVPVKEHVNIFDCVVAIFLLCCKRTVIDRQNS
jgi:hypothetical protein